jgi:hypothetical protein
MAKNRKTFQKTQREMEKKRKAQQKLTDKQRKKVPAAEPVGPADEFIVDNRSAE